MRLPKENKIEIERYLNEASKHLFKVQNYYIKVSFINDKWYKIQFMDGILKAKNEISINNYNDIVDSNALCQLKHTIFYPELKHESIRRIKEFDIIIEKLKQTEISNV